MIRIQGLDGAGGGGAGGAGQHFSFIIKDYKLPIENILILLFKTLFKLRLVDIWKVETGGRREEPEYRIGNKGGTKIEQIINVLNSSKITKKYDLTFKSFSLINTNSIKLNTLSTHMYKKRYSILH